MRAATAATGVAALVCAICSTSNTRVDAMPVFAQAYGVDCSVCHTSVPLLNAHGRYVQRSGYAALQAKTLKRRLPVWLDETITNDSQNPQFPHQTKFGTLAVHAAGAVDSSFTYHVQQFLVNGDQPGGLDTAWVAYSHLFRGYGHLFAGKIQVPAPSPYSQSTDISPFATPELVVGEHTWQLDTNRWGVKLGYLRDPVSLEVGYVGSSADLNGATDFVPGNGKAFQWRATYAREDRPFETGLYGSVGTIPLSTGGVDRFSSIAAYVQRDPVRGVPGVFAVAQYGRDANPGAGLGASASRAYAVELFQPLFHGDALIGLRRELTDDGLGTIRHSANVDLTVRIARYLRFYGEAALQQNLGPAWRWGLRWTTPIDRQKFGPVTAR